MKENLIKLHSSRDSINDEKDFRSTELIKAIEKQKKKPLMKVNDNDEDDIDAFRERTMSEGTIEENSDEEQSF